MSRRRLLALTVLVEGSALVLAWGLGTLFAAPPFAAFSVSGGAVGWGLLASGPLFAGLAWVQRSALPPLVRFREEVHGLTRLFERCTVLDLAVVSALAGLCEEALFRGFLQAALADAFGVGLALIAASLVFGLAHYLSSTYAVYAAVVGAYLGLLLLLSGNLLVPILAHAAYDFGALLLLVRGRGSGAGC